MSATFQKPPDHVMYYVSSDVKLNSRGGTKALSAIDNAAEIEVAINLLDSKNGIKFELGVQASLPVFMHQTAVRSLAKT